jgi:magnesium chelatase family protein
VVRRYSERLSGPLLDRIDLRVRVSPPAGRVPGEPTVRVRERVMVARDRAAHRLATVGEQVNCRVSGETLRRLFPPAPQAVQMLDEWYRDNLMSLRALDRVTRVCWTLADLRGAERPDADDVVEAVALRNTISGRP